MGLPEFLLPGGEVLADKNVHPSISVKLTYALAGYFNSLEMPWGRDMTTKIKR
jgi:hypothetical protein